MNKAVIISLLALSLFSCGQKADVYTLHSGDITLIAERLGKAAAPLLNELSIDCVLFGGQISKSFFLMERSLCQSLSSVPSLRFVGPLPDLDHATFNGLRSLK